MGEDDGARACAEAIERFSFEGRYANPVYLEHIAGIIRAYRDREVAEALAFLVGYTGETLRAVRDRAALGGGSVRTDGTG